MRNAPLPLAIAILSSAVTVISAVKRLRCTLPKYGDAGVPAFLLHNVALHTNKATDQQFAVLRHRKDGRRLDTSHRPGNTCIGGRVECYVCTPWADTVPLELRRLFPQDSLPVCGYGQGLIAKVCPPSYRGCLTQTNGTMTTRTCGEVDVEVCRTANGIRYCYCRGSLCNGPTAVPDDEDLAQEGGSGDHASEDMDVPLQAEETTAAQPDIVHRSSSRAAAFRTEVVLLWIAVVLGLTESTR